MSEKSRHKLNVPLGWALYSFFIVFIQTPVSLYVIILSFQGSFWEQSLEITGLSRWIAVFALFSFGWSIYFLIGVSRKIVQIVRESEEQDLQ